MITHYLLEKENDPRGNLHRKFYPTPRPAYYSSYVKERKPRSQLRFRFGERSRRCTQARTPLPRDMSRRHDSPGLSPHRRSSTATRERLRLRELQFASQLRASWCGLRISHYRIAHRSSPAAHGSRHAMPLRAPNQHQFS